MISELPLDAQTQVCRILDAAARRLLADELPEMRHDSETGEEVLTYVWQLYTYATVEEISGADRERTP